MSYRPRVFISHSAKEEEARKLCEAISQHLGTDDFEVLWDQQSLETSNAWRPAIEDRKSVV